jgi:hypothetical protein
MNKVRWLVLSVLAAATFTTSVMAEDVKDARELLNQVSKALGATDLKSLHYEGSGSSYLVQEGPVPAGGWPHSVMRSYVRDIDPNTVTSRIVLLRVEETPPAEKTLTREIDSKSPWPVQAEFWITPYGFLRGAMANNATVESKTVFGTPYKAVTFHLPGGPPVVGYINDKNMIERIETRTSEKEDGVIEALYRDYADFNGVNFPTLITEKRGGQLSLILIVKEVKVGN